MNDLPVIGLSTGRMFLEGSNLTGMERVIVNGDYIGAVKKAGGLSVPVPPVCSPDEIRQYVKLCDGIIITGGLDAAPILYGEMPHPGCGIFDLDMDRTHIELIREAIRQGKPLLGICRGMQLINVALGGTLYQDIPSQCPGCGGHSYTYIRGDAVHSVTLDEGSPLHQDIRPDCSGCQQHPPPIRKRMRKRRRDLRPVCRWNRRRPLCSGTKDFRHTMASRNASHKIRRIALPLCRLHRAVPVINHLLIQGVYTNG